MWYHNMFPRDWATSARKSYKTGKLGRSKCLFQYGEVPLVHRWDNYFCNSLRRRFMQNQQDISFTIMALLPTLGEHILTGMDVEGVTQELQSQSRASKAATPLPASEQPSNSSITSSVEVLPQPEQDARSENDYASIISGPTQDDATSTSDLAASSQSWVDHFSSMQSSQHVSEAGPSHGTSSSSASGSLPNPDSPKSNLGTDLSDSVITTSSAISYGDANLVSTLCNPHGFGRILIPRPALFPKASACDGKF